MFSWNVPGERIITLMTAGNLATTQAVVTQLKSANKVPGDRHPSIPEAPTMSPGGRGSRSPVAAGGGRAGRLPNRAWAKAGRAAFYRLIIVAGQICGMTPRLFLIYPEGNFIEATFDTPVLPDRRDQVRSADLTRP
jgi:putative proteasome-type protease